MASRVKKRTDTATNRESDKIITRLPAGMRAHLAELAARQGRSMNAVVVTALAGYIARDGDVDTTTVKAALAEMKQEIQYLRDTLGWKHHEPTRQTGELLREARKGAKQKDVQQKTRQSED
jgi:hypothetical protein